jgi:hypothetical protein
MERWYEMYVTEHLCDSIKHAEDIFFAISQSNIQQHHWAYAAYRTF